MNKTRLLMILGVILLSLVLVGMALAADNTRVNDNRLHSFDTKNVTSISGSVSNPPPETSGSRSGVTDTTPPVVYVSAASFSQGFDDVTILPGWYSQNNSAPLGSLSWYQGVDSVFPAQSGAPTAYIAANYNSTSGTGTISNWLLTPQLALANGATFSFWTRTTAGSGYPDRLQVRLSTAGSSTNVGTTESSVGDFTTLLLDVNPTLTVGGFPEAWTQYVITLSGIPIGSTGKFAFRYYVTNGGPTGSNSNYIGVDTVEYNLPPPLISVNPLSLHSTQQPDRMTTQQLQICNIEGFDLSWKISEVPANHVGVVLLIETTDTTNSLQHALKDLGYPYNYFHGNDWTSLDFTPYNVVIVGMDGGTIEAPSLQKVRMDVINAGKRLIFIGGTAYQNFALGVNQYLVLNNTANYSWKISSTPHFTIVDPTNPLAQGLITPYNFVNSSAAYYQMRVTDPNIEAVAMNGDGYTNFFYKGVNFPLILGDAPQVVGDFIWFVNSPNGNYWTNPADFNLLKNLLSNAIQASTILGTHLLSESSYSGITSVVETPAVNRVPDILDLSYWDGDSYDTPTPYPCSRDTDPTSSASDETCWEENSPTGDLNQTPVIPDSSIDPLSTKVAPNSVNRPSQLTHPGTLLGTILYEGFETGIMPPADWTVLQTNPTKTWKIAAVGTPFEGTHFADVEYDPALVPQNEVLMTPMLDISNAILDFWSMGSIYWCRDTLNNCDLNIWIVIGAWDGGAGNDIFVGKADDAWTSNFIWSNSIFDLTPLLPGVPIRIAFQYTGADGAQIGLDSIRLDIDIPWLITSPMTGTVQAGNCSDIDVTFDSTNTVPGNYYGALRIDSNASNEPFVNVFVSMTVTNYEVYLPVTQKH